MDGCVRRLVVVGCVGRCVMVRWMYRMDVSVVGLMLYGCVDGCVGRWVDVWMCG